MSETIVIDTRLMFYPIVYLLVSNYRSPALNLCLLVFPCSLPLSCSQPFIPCPQYITLFLICNPLLSISVLMFLAPFYLFSVSVFLFSFKINEINIILLNIYYTNIFSNLIWRVITKSFFFILHVIFSQYINQNNCFINKHLQWNPLNMF